MPNHGYPPRRVRTADVKPDFTVSTLPLRKTYACGPHVSSSYRTGSWVGITPRLAALLKNQQRRASGSIYRITIYLGHAGGNYIGRVPRFGGAALPHSQVRGRRGRGGARRGTRAAAVSALAGASRTPRGRGSDDSRAGGPAGAEASQRRGTDRSSGDSRLRAPEPQPGRPPARPGGAAAARGKTARTGRARPHRRVAR